MLPMSTGRGWDGCLVFMASGVVGVLLVVSLVGGQAPARSEAWRSEAYILLTERSRGSPRERPEFLARTRHHERVGADALTRHG